MASKWEKTECSACAATFPVHSDWECPPKKYTPCQLIEGDFIDAIKLIVTNNYMEPPAHVRSQLSKIMDDTNDSYKKSFNTHLYSEAMKTDDILAGLSYLQSLKHVYLDFQTDHNRSSEKNLITQDIWKAEEKKLAALIFSEKDILKFVLAVMKQLKKNDHVEGQAKADARNIERAALIISGKRRIS